jgi:hypothetical protein
LPRLTRLPNGTKPKVDQSKALLKSFIPKLEKKKFSTPDEFSSLLLSLGHIENVGCYAVDNTKLHVDFDYVVPGFGVGAYYVVDFAKHKLQLGSTCTVFTCTYDENDDEYIVDNYKW